MLEAAPGVALFTTAAQTVPGLTGSYVNQSLRFYSPQDDWRVTQAIAGTRVDPKIDFTSPSWGNRAGVGLTGGTNANWEQFSVQWDGYLRVNQATHLWTHSDDGSRLWIDLDQNGSFASSGAEFVNNNWGAGQPAHNGPTSVLINPGLYRVRLQYEEGAGGNVMQLVSEGPHLVRIGYLVPSNRTAQPHAVAALQNSLRWYQAFYSDQMERNGFGPKTFQFETEADGLTPKIHVVHGPNADDYYRADPFGRVTEALQNAGLSVGAKEAWLQFYEGHLQASDGSLSGAFFGGFSFGSGSDGGRALVGSDALVFMRPEFLLNAQAYDGHIEPLLGPYPMQYSPGNVPPFTFVDFIGSTFSEISSSFQGGGLHELSHAFGLPHDFRNDENFDGNLMGNGHRGFRGWLYPDLFPQNDMRLEYASALAMNSSRYFNPGRPVTDNTSPAAGFFTSGTVAAVAGLLEVTYTAFDTSGLAAAWLLRNGELIGEMQLSGTSTTSTFKTPFYTPGLSDQFSVMVYDTQGNRTEASTFITVQPASNRAPQPFIDVSPSTAKVGQAVLLDASFSFDPDGSSAQLKYEWDLNDDGVFDTALSSSSTLTTSFATPGVRRIRARVTDSAGAKALSAPIGIRITGTAPPTESSEFLLSANGPAVLVSSNGSKLNVADNDIFKLLRDGDDYQFSMYFDGSDVGLSTSDEDVDALSILDDGSIILSTEGPFSVKTTYSRPGTGSGVTLSGDREDLLRFMPSSLGANTSGTWSLYLDGSKFGLSGKDENIDAAMILPDGRIVVSVQGNFSAPGASGADEDLFALDKSTGRWSLYFDGSDVGLSASDEDIDALSLEPNAGGLPTLYFSTRGDFSVAGASGKDDDVVAFTPTRLGSTTAGSFASPLKLDGSQVGLSAINIDALHIGTASGLLGGPTFRSVEPSEQRLASSNNATIAEDSIMRVPFIQTRSLGLPSSSGRADDMVPQRQASNFMQTTDARPSTQLARSQPSSTSLVYLDRRAIDHVLANLKWPTQRPRPLTLPLKIAAGSEIALTLKSELDSN